MIASFASLAVGVLIGYLGQKSRFCIVSGMRDAILIRNFHRIKGLIGLLLGGVIGYSLFKLVGGAVLDFPMFSASESSAYLLASIVGGVGIGFYSVMAEGCPFRQHVMAAEGKKSAIWYLAGFYIGIIYFYLVTVKLLALLLTGTT